MFLLNNKKHLTVIIPALFALSLIALAASDTANINITANVVDSTCVPDWEGKIQVDFGSVQVINILNRDQSPAGEFNLRLKECGSDIKAVSVKSNGKVADKNKEIFENMAGEKAEKTWGCQ